MSPDPFIMLSTLVAFGLGYHFQRAQLRRALERVYLAQRSESEAIRSLAAHRQKLADLQKEFDQAAHELASRQTASEDQARLGALLFRLAEILGVREEAFGGIAEVSILAAAKTAAESAERTAADFQVVISELELELGDTKASLESYQAIAAHRLGLVEDLRNRLRLAGLQCDLSAPGRVAEASTADLDQRDRGLRGDL